uniref:Uncharacterized protein n=1 Tax=Strongyloides venezuelensis TaxID=75913 RepID=A0A0K0G0R0_STRVS
MNLNVRQYNLGAKIVVADSDWATHNLKNDLVDIPAHLRPDPDAETIPSCFREQDRFGDGDNRWNDTGLSTIPFWHAPPLRSYPRQF